MQSDSTGATVDAERVRLEVRKELGDLEFVCEEAGATLKLSHDKYRFSVSKTVKKGYVTGSPAKPFKLTLKVTGAVTSSTTITGTVSLRGGRCTSKRPIPYTAKLDNKIPVSPGD